MPPTAEDFIHGGYLHLAREELDRRLNTQTPSLYDCLLTSIYFRKAGDQDRAIEALDIHPDSEVFDATYNRLQSLCHKLQFEEASAAAIHHHNLYREHWNEEQRQYAQDVHRVTQALATAGVFPSPTATQLAPNHYFNLDSNEATPCTGLVSTTRQLGRVVDAVFDPVSRCWINQREQAVIGELLQPNHDFRSFYGGAVPWQAPTDASKLKNLDDVKELAIFVEANPHFGHFVTQSASFANALGYAEHLVSLSEAIIVVLSAGEIPGWAQELMQASCPYQLRFKRLDPAQPLRCHRLVVAPPTWIEWHYVHHDHQRLFRKAASDFLGWTPTDQSESRRLLYFSRSRLGQCLRRSVNEEELETALQRYGFEVVHPQELALHEVAELVNEAAIVCGAVGSAMHNVLFRLPGAPMITVNFAHYLPAINNTMLERACGIELNCYVRSAEEEDTGPGEPSHLIFDIPRCLEGVERVLDQFTNIS